MPRNKDLKRLARARMQKTGESYTAARAKLVHKTAKTQTPELAQIAGVADETVRAKTGRAWSEWVTILDARGATSMPHRDVAKFLHEEHELSRWWAQSVTVGYERIRGLREVGQRRGGTYEANKSKTFSVSVAKLYAAFSVARTRARWLPDVSWNVRTSQARKSMRITWHDATSVQLYFTGKSPDKSQVAIQHVKLPSKSVALKTKDYWSERLAHLASIIEAPKPAARSRHK